VDPLFRDSIDERWIFRGVLRWINFLESNIDCLSIKDSKKYYIADDCGEETM